MKTNMKLTAVFRPEEDGGYIAYIEEMPGVNTQGDNLEEAKSNLMEALTMVMEVRREMAKKEILTAVKKSSKQKIITEEIFLGV
ncbi:MAG: type II toxin-antitoxin system HicB family antitoxin [Bacteroidales bacterium]|nr:type II toxin-antitoxin system HicB family antitoxin [Bacteroidales bacterium]